MFFVDIGLAKNFDVDIRKNSCHTKSGNIISAKKINGYAEKAIYLKTVRIVRNV